MKFGGDRNIGEVQETQEAKQSNVSREVKEDNCIYENKKPRDYKQGNIQKLSWKLK